MSELTESMVHAQKLKRSVQAMSPAEMPEPDVDRIMPLVQEGLASWGHIRDRVRLVREQLHQAKQEISES